MIYTPGLHALTRSAHARRRNIISTIKLPQSHVGERLAQRYCGIASTMHAARGGQPLTALGAVRVWVGSCGHEFVRWPTTCVRVYQHHLSLQYQPVCVTRGGHGKLQTEQNNYVVIRHPPGGGTGGQHTTNNRTTWVGDSDSAPTSTTAAVLSRFA